MNNHFLFFINTKNVYLSYTVIMLTKYIKING